MILLDTRPGTLRGPSPSRCRSSQASTWFYRLAYLAYNEVMAKKKGMVKYTDPEKGYGYILNENAKDPKKTILFEAKDVTSEIEELDEGSVVEYEEAENATRATNVSPANSSD